MVEAMVEQEQNLCLRGEGCQSQGGQVCRYEKVVNPEKRKKIPSGLNVWLNKNVSCQRCYRDSPYDPLSDTFGNLITIADGPGLKSHPTELPENLP